MIDLATARLRAGLIAAVRGFFGDAGYLEVDTPHMAERVIPESTIELFPARFSNPYGEDRELYLLPSPEYWLKKVQKLFPDTPIFQLNHAFRNREQTGRHHNIEFTMLEWYAPGTDYRTSEETARGLITSLAVRAGIAPPECGRMSVEEAFRELAGIDLAPLCGDREMLLEAAEEHGVACAESDSWNDIFQRIFISLIEPALPTEEPLFLYDYPARIVCLAKEKPGTPWRERWELYWKGIELANCYTEMIDPEAVRRLFEEESAEKERVAAIPTAVDGEYWKTFTHPYPESSGVALGFDRLLMLIAGRESLDEVIYFPFRPGVPG